MRQTRRLSPAASACSLLYYSSCLRVCARALNVRLNDVCRRINNTDALLIFQHQIGFDQVTAIVSRTRHASDARASRRCVLSAVYSVQCSLMCAIVRYLIVCVLCTQTQTRTDVGLGRLCARRATHAAQQAGECKNNHYYYYYGRAVNVCTRTRVLAACQMLAQRATTHALDRACAHARSSRSSTEAQLNFSKLKYILQRY